MCKKYLVLIERQMALSFVGNVQSCRLLEFQYISVISCFVLVMALQLRRLSLGRKMIDLRLAFYLRCLVFKRRTRFLLARIISRYTHVCV
jgi:hypothetical protein